jgi:hypothetical protein
MVSTLAKTKKKKNTPRQKHWIEDISFVTSYPILGVATKCHQFQSNPKHEKLIGIGGQKLTCQKMMNKRVWVAPFSPPLMY